MAAKSETHAEPGNDTVETLLHAILPHVPFDGWSAEAFTMAVEDSGVARALADGLCPRGAVDLAVAYHRQGDAQMVAALERVDLEALKIREKVARAVRVRLQLVEDRELVRRGTTLFALPQHAATGAELIWGTSDAIWTVLGDSSDDLNWYSKRAMLSAVYGATVLYWLGDDSDGHEATWAFLERHIQDVMRIEGAKAQFKSSPLGKALSGPLAQLTKIRPPQSRSGLPGRWRR